MGKTGAHWLILPRALLIPITPPGGGLSKKPVSLKNVKCLLKQSLFITSSIIFSSAKLHYMIYAAHPFRYCELFQNCFRNLKTEAMYKNLKSNNCYHLSHRKKKLLFVPKRGRSPDPKFTPSARHLQIYTYM